jgi:predicted MFS family arabinose efflux permease
MTPSSTSITVHTPRLNQRTTLGASLLIGISASVAQQIVPFAASMADEDKRGATIGTVMSGLLCGILFGRALAGIVSDHFGWRMMFVVGLILSLAVAALMRLELPRSHPQAGGGSSRWKLVSAFPSLSCNLLLI